MSLLTTQGLTRRFGGLVAVDDVTVEVAEGELLGLIGPNGAGKSTLFAMIAGDQQPSAGRLHFDGSDVTGWAPHQAARAGVGRTFQLMRGFPSLTVRENVLAAAHLRHRKHRDALQAADEVIELLGMQGLCGRRAGTLTAASRKQLELARALGTRPRLLLLDEVLSGLTPAESRAAVRTVRQVHASGITIVMVEHVLEVIMGLCSRVLVLHHGELLSQGTPEQVVNDPAVVEAYLGSGAFGSGAPPATGAPDPTEQGGDR